MSRVWALGLVLLVALGVVHPASAHEFRPAVLALRQLDAETYAVGYEPPLDASKQPISAVRPTFDPACELAVGSLRCPSGALGTVRVDGLVQNQVDVVVRVTWLDGSSRTAVLRGHDDSIELTSAAGADSAGTLAQFVVLGIEHIAFGIDHVLFVLGLAMLVGFGRRLLWTVTGFTIAHSITLAGATLGLVTLPQGPVEAVIAISIVLLAVEVARDRPSLTRRIPGVVAFGFGLLHGFGFAGALAEVGLPPDRAGLALLGFNLGVELGQVAILGLAFVVTRPWRHRLGGRVRLAVAYAGGTVATAWTFERLAALA